MEDCNEHIIWCTSIQEKIKELAELAFEYINKIEYSTERLKYAQNEHWYNKSLNYIYYWNKKYKEIGKELLDLKGQLEKVQNEYIEEKFSEITSQK